LYAWLSGDGYEVTVVSTFEAARHHLDSEPSLLVSEIRLADYNGLQLALRAQTRNIAAIVIGEPDLVLERDAHQMDAAYVPPDVAREDLLTLVRRGIDARQPREAAASTSADVSPLFLSWRDFKNSVADVGGIFAPRRRVTAS
jgi:DNA-binding NtrC family response regulator